MKDRFSNVAKQYAKYRPYYPDSLIQFLLQQTPDRHCALDVGTGNGQVAGMLAKHFYIVKATDISQQQIEQAIKKPNIGYSVQSAESFNFPDNSFDLVTVAQAVHWFNFDSFFAEVKRTLCTGGIIAVWGYGLIETAGSLNTVIKDFYEQLRNFWDAERVHIDEAYANIPFPFVEIEAPSYQIDVKWTLDELTGFLSTWSAVKAYKEENGTDPVEAILPSFKLEWGEERVRPFWFKIFMKVGRK